MERIRIAICGYGSLGKGVEKAISQNPDMELVGIFSKSPAEVLNTTSTVLSMENVKQYSKDIDVVVICGDSANDLEKHVPKFARYFNTVDNFEIHEKIDEYYEIIDDIAYETEHISIISVGQDPGLFSIIRLFGGEFLLDGKNCVHFDSKDQVEEKYFGVPYEGFVIRNGITGENTKQLMEFYLKLESNTEFTASVLLAYARAAYKMYEGFFDKGAKTVYDVPPILLSPKSKKELLKNLL